jgi:CHAT domain-containing protein
VKSADISTVIANSRIRLAVLSACQSGETRGETIFSGIGPAMILAGVPVVVAMQLPITVSAAAEFVRGFYEALVNTKTLLIEIHEGRLNLMRSGEWFIPVMYWRNNEKDEQV